MKLNVYASNSRRGESSYVVEPADWVPAKPTRPEVVAALLKLVPRIEAMVRKQLGERFLSFEQLNGEMFVLKVQTGTSTAPETRFKFRELCGWISLFASE